MSINNINIEFKPSTKQYKAWLALTSNDNINFVGYGGSAFSGKSYLMCYWLLSMALAYPNTAWGLGRKELTTLKKTTLQTLLKVMNESNVQIDRDYKFNQQLNYIEFNNTSRIYLIDTAFKPSDPLYQRFGGYELTGCGIDESGETDELAITTLFTRLGRKENTKYNITPKMLETFNPSKTHVYRRYYKPFVDKTLQKSYIFIPALPSDNPDKITADKYITNIINNADKTTVQRLIYGNFEYDDDPSALMSYDNICSLWSNNHIIIKENNNITGSKLKDGKISKDKYISVDPARLGKDKTVIMIWTGFIIVDIVTLSKSRTNETSEVIKNLQKKYNIPSKNIIIDTDGVGGGVADNIVNSLEFNNNGKPLNGENYENIKSQLYFKLSEMVNNNEICIINDNKQIKSDIIEELEQVKKNNIDRDGKLGIVPKNIIKQLIGRSPDYSDAMMMRMIYTLKKTNNFDFAVVNF
jgi:hypothetical protein